MTLRELIAKLQSIEAQHGGELEVFSVHEPSGYPYIWGVDVEANPVRVVLRSDD